jgi:D-3-phosphoglycerate dehydrogenase
MTVRKGDDSCRRGHDARRDEETLMFHVGLTRDFLMPDGTLAFGDIGLGLLESVPGLKYDFLAEDTRELSAEQVRDYDALLVLAPRVTRATLAGADRLTVLARFGVGYDTVDVEACTEHGVLLTITPDGVRRPVATSVLTFLLALSHKLPQKDALTRQGRWGEKLRLMGVGLVGRVLGIVGFGNIGREVAAITRPLDMRVIAADPYVSPEQAAAAGAELVDLDTLMQTADFVSINCALTPETRHLIDGKRLALMKPTAYLINTARGPVVDEQALVAVLRDRRIAGAGIDVFEQEPADPKNPLFELDNVILAPHAICWTDECFLNNGRSACQSILEVAAGRLPRHIVNRAVLEIPRLTAKLRRYAEQARG